LASKGSGEPVGCSIASIVAQLRSRHKDE